MPSTCHRILLVDDHRIILDGLKLILGIIPSLNVVGMATNGEEALAMGRQLGPDLVFMGLQLPALNGIEVGKLLKCMECPPLVLLYENKSGRALNEQVRAAGLDGCLSNNMGAHEVRMAVIHVLSGGHWFMAPKDGTEASQEPEGMLTSREQEILRSISEGMSNMDMAIRLGISIRTVETHRRNLIRKLGTSKVSAMVRIAQSKGLC